MPVGKFLGACVVAACLGFVAWIDLTTGFEITVLPLYALPIGLAARVFGSSAALMAAGASAAAWAWADAAAGHVYSKSWILWFNAGARLVVFILLAVLVRNTLAATSRARRPRAPAPHLPVCTQCGRVRDRDGYWWTLRDYIREHPDERTPFRICSDCARQVHARVPAEPASHFH
jgi:low affinity Fe/Cu permease